MTDPICPIHGVEMLPAQGARRPEPGCMECLADARRAPDPVMHRDPEAEPDTFGLFEPEMPLPYHATEPWEHRAPQLDRDAHHDQAIVLSGSVLWQQSTPTHAGGARYQPRDPQDRRRARRLLAEACASLTPGQSAALELREAGYSYAEIAERLGVGLHAIRERLARGRKALRATTCD